MRRTASSDELYFITLTVVDWVDIFTRPLYKDYLVDNLSYCQKHKGLEIFAYVIMTNHVHMIAQSQNMSDWLRDFKSYTSKGLYKLVESNETESRKEWMLDIFQRHGKTNELNKDFQVWQNGSYPVCLPENYLSMIRQKTDYIHDNPVRAGFVSEAHMYTYSSANPQSPLKMNE